MTYKYIFHICPSDNRAPYINASATSDQAIVEVEGTEYIEVQAAVGESVSIVMTGTDPEDSVISYTLLEQPPSSAFTYVEQANGTFVGTFTPTNTDPVKLQ